MNEYSYRASNESSPRVNERGASFQEFRINEKERRERIFSQIYNKKHKNYLKLKQEEVRIDKRKELFIEDLKCRNAEKYVSLSSVGLSK
jgi:hypothetical protein